MNIYVLFERKIFGTALNNWASGNKILDDKIVNGCILEKYSNELSSMTILSHNKNQNI